MGKTIFISAGEASGEQYGALLADALKKLAAERGLGEPRFVGMAGPRMEAAGVERIVRAEDMAVMGITEIVRHLPRIYAEFRKLKKAIREIRPQAAVLIDFPDIHLKLAEEFHRLGIPVIFFVSPQLWAWKKHRIKTVQKFVDRMLVIFPFEEGYYRERGVDAEFVGHPLAELPLPTVSREEFAAGSGLDAGKQWIGLLPGSRMKEIRSNLPEMLKAAFFLHDDYLENARMGFRAPQPEFVLPVAATLTETQRAELAGMVREQAVGLAIRIVGDARAALFHARASIVASGTATVEAALIGNPFVVVYRVSPLTYAIAKRVVKVPHVAMANLIADRRVVPELIQDEFTASNIVKELRELLPDGLARQSMVEGLAGIRGLLRPRDGAGAIERVAEIVLGEIGA